jgi:dipeptidyl aminopeptidase/acylaminoacyl peptidase
VSAGGETRIYRVALVGRENCAVIAGGERICGVFDCRGGKVLFSSQTCNTPPDLCIVDLDGGNERRLSAHNDAWQREIRWPDVERVRVKSARNVEIEGWVLKPKHVRAPYKTILYIHGGPHAGFGYSFNSDFQELVGAGYAVAFANPRGSTGYGDAFSTSILERWGELEAQDFNAFLDALIERGISHKNRLGVTGVSGGGHLSGWLIGHTHRFKAAVPEQGVYNLISMYGVSDAGSALLTLEMGGEPHELPERYWAASPLAHAHTCRTPTLLIQGENDLRCPMEQAEQMYTVLKRSGCTVELLRLKNCNHGLEIAGPPPLRRYRMNAMIDWFDRYLK